MTIGDARWVLCRLGHNFKEVYSYFSFVHLLARLMKCLYLRGGPTRIRLLVTRMSPDECFLRPDVQPVSRLWDLALPPPVIRTAGLVSRQLR
jgi:hypothetical protein